MKALSSPVADGRGSAPPRPGSGPELYVYVTADRVDRALAGRVGEALGALGVTAAVSPDPSPEQKPWEIRRAQRDQLESCDGVLLVYGAAPATWIQSQFAFARRVVALRRRGVWCALLDGAPSPRPAVRLSSPSLMMLDPRRDLEAELGRFVEALRADGGVRA